MTRSVCWTTPPSTILPAFGSSGIWPAVKMKPLVMIPCEYGPIADGALSVLIVFSGIQCSIRVRCDSRERGDGECYTLSSVQSQTKQPLRIERCNGPEVCRIGASDKRKPGDCVCEPRRIGALATERHRREVGRVGFDEQPVLRHQSKEVVVRPFLEG